MPIWLRKFTFNSIKKHFEDQKEANEKAYKSRKAQSPKVSKPNIKPTYTSKASK